MNHGVSTAACVFAAALCWGCSNSSSSASPAGAVDGGGGGEGGGAGAGGGAGGTAGSGGASGASDAGGPPARTQCPYPQAPCGQHCFSTVGEQFGACTLLALPDGNDQFRSAGWDGQSIYVVELFSGLLAIDKGTGQKKTVSTEASFRGTPVVGGGYIYIDASFQTDAGNKFGLQRLPVSGGPLEFLTADGIADHIEPTYFTLIDGALYFAGDGGLRSVPVGGGASTVVTSDSVDSIVADDTYFYYHSDYPNFDVRRAPRATPSQSTELVPYTTSGDVFLWPSDPANVYVMSEWYQKVPRAGGAAVKLRDKSFTFIGGIQGTSHVLLDEAGIVYALSIDGQTLDVVDRGSPPILGLFEDDASYYMASPMGVFRIAK